MCREKAEGKLTDCSWVRRSNLHMYRAHHRCTTCEYSDQCWRISSRLTRCTLHTRNIHTPNWCRGIWRSKYFYHATLCWRGIFCRRVSVCPSVCHKPVLYGNDWTNRAFFWRGGFLPPIPHCIVRNLGISKIGYFLWNFFPNSGLRIFATASRSGCQQKSSSSSTVELVDDAYTTIDESWLFTTSRPTVTL